MAVSYTIFNASGEVLLSDIRYVCFVRQDLHKFSKTDPPKWWVMHDFLGIAPQLGDMVPEVEFFLDTIRPYVPEIPKTARELFANGVRLDCDERCAGYSRIVGGHLRALLERTQFIKDFPATYETARQAGVEHSLATLFAATYTFREDTWLAIPRIVYAHSLYHNHESDYLRLWPSLLSRNKRYVPMSKRMRASRSAWAGSQVSSLIQCRTGARKLEQDVEGGETPLQFYVRMSKRATR